MGAGTKDVCAVGSGGAVVGGSGTGSTKMGAGGAVVGGVVSDEMFAG